MLRAEGHPEAYFYPVGYVWNEVRFVIRRNNQRMSSEAILTQAVIGSVVDAKKGGAILKKLLKDLDHGD